MSNNPGLVAALFDGMGLPIKRVAQASLVLLALLYWLAPATFQAGLNAWIQIRTERMTEIMSDYLDHLGTPPAPVPAVPADGPVAPSP